jgi:hypothetical protein
MIQATSIKMKFFCQLRGGGECERYTGNLPSEAEL